MLQRRYETTVWFQFGDIVIQLLKVLLKFCVTTYRILIPLMVLIADRINERPILLIWYSTIYGFEYVADKFAPQFMTNSPSIPTPAC